MLKELFDFLAAHNISPNGLMCLEMRSTNVNRPGIIQPLIEERKLHLAGFLYKAEPTHQVLSLTEKANHLLNDVETLLAKSKKKKKALDTPFEQWQENIQKYLDLFPGGLQGSAPIKVPPKMLHPRFQWFFGEYPQYDWALVLKATDQYLLSLEKGDSGMKYITTSKYFISKQENGGKVINSKLAEWCEAVLTGTTDSIQDQGHGFFPTNAV